MIDTTYINKIDLTPENRIRHGHDVKQYDGHTDPIFLDDRHLTMKVILSVFPSEPTVCLSLFSDF